MAAMAPSSSSSVSLPPPDPARAPSPCPRLLLLSRKAAAATAPPRPLILSFPPHAPARRRIAWLRADAAQQSSAEYQFDDEEESGEEDYEYEEDDEDWEEEDDDDVDVEAMEEEARGAAAELAKRLARELHIDDDVREKRKSSRDKTSASKHVPDSLLPKVAIIGRPNVGKSALFNRLVGATGLLLSMNLV